MRLVTPIRTIACPITIIIERYATVVTDTFEFNVVAIQIRDVEFLVEQIELPIIILLARLIRRLRRPFQSPFNYTSIRATGLRCISFLVLGIIFRK